MKLHYAFPITSWDEGVPIGNALIGAIIWGDAREAIISLDQATLWDERLPRACQSDDWTFAVMLELIRRQRWKELSSKFESPGEEPYPTKLRSCRLILRLRDSDRWIRAELDISNGEAVLYSKKGEAAISCDASRPLLAIRTTGVTPEVRLDFPDYQGESCTTPGPRCLSALGYPPAERGRRNGVTFSVQRDTAGNATVSAMRMRKDSGATEVIVCVSGLGNAETKLSEACALLDQSTEQGYASIRRLSTEWWKSFWSHSRATISHKEINHHYQLGQYFLGCSSRSGAPPMPLQGVWTADDGRLPPWRGDFHHNLNTQFCYISYLSNNRLEQGLPFLEHMWQVLPKHKELAKRFFDAPGAFVPGAMSLAGHLICGWAPYSFNLSNGAWVADMFFRHWKYTLDPRFLRERAYPYCLAQAEFLLHLLKADPLTGRMLLPMSTSAEIYDNTPRAYLPANTNYDHFNMLKLFQSLAEMSAALGRKKESVQWRGHAKSLGAPALVRVPSPDDLISGDVLAIAPGTPLDRSHRHHAHLMGIYPHGLLHPSHSRTQAEIISNSLHQIDLLGTGEWVGYSFSWYAALCARVGRGSAAISMLERYLEAFVSPNGFHLNGDFKNLGYSVYKYRPFTLEGNFAAVQAVNELLLQTIQGCIYVGYSLPAGIAASFENLRVEGGFLISADICDSGEVRQLKIQSTVGGLFRLANPWPQKSVLVRTAKASTLSGAVIEFDTKPGESYILTRR